MVVKTFDELRTDMPVPQTGAISGADIINLTDTVENATTQEVVYQNGSYTTSSADNRRFFALSSATANTFTVPTGIPIGWEIALLQQGTGQVTISIPVGEFRHPDNHTKTAKQWSMVFLKCIWDGGASGPTIVMSGDTAL